MPDGPARTPDRRCFTARERAVVDACRTPRQVQRWLRQFPYNWERNGATLRTFRGAMRARQAHCLEAVLCAAAVLEQHGWPPTVLDLESEDKLDHVLFLYRYRGRWGTVARSRDEGLHGRRPVFDSIEALVESYFDPYVDGTGRIVGYGVAHLDALVRTDWRLSTRHVWSVERALIVMPHRRIRMPERRYREVLSRYRDFRAAHPAPAPRDWRRHYAGQTASWL